MFYLNLGYYLNNQKTMIEKLCGLMNRGKRKAKKIAFSKTLVNLKFQVYMNCNVI